jgi:hypothetical protein
VSICDIHKIAVPDVRRANEKPRPRPGFSTTR